MNAELLAIHNVKFSAKGVIRGSIFALICICLFVQGYVRFVSNMSLAMVLGNAALVVAGVLGVLLMLMDGELYSVGYVCFACVSWIIGYLMRPEWQYSVKFMLSSFSYMGVAYYLARRKQNAWMVKAIFYFFSLFLLYELLLLKVHYTRIMRDGTSHNYISIILLMYLGVIALIESKTNKSLSIPQALLFLMICVLAYGRGGILCGVLLFGGIFILRIKSDKNKKKKFAVLTGMIVLGCIFGARFLSFLDKGKYFQKFQDKGMDSAGRFGIWKMFFHTCTESFTAFILGGNPGVITIANKNHEGNLHNSFLEMYAVMGLFFFCVNLILIALATVKNIKWKNKYVLVFIIPFFLRIATDKAMFRGGCEIVYYYFIFDYFIKTAGSARLKRQSGNMKPTILDTLCKKLKLNVSLK